MDIESQIALPANVLISLTIRSQSSLREMMQPLPLTHINSAL